MSEPSAIAILMWYDCPHWTSASAVKTVVYPSALAIVSKPAELSTKYWAFIGVTLLTDEIVIGSGGLEPGTIAKLTEPFGWLAGEEYGPDMPGPERKKPNTSFQIEFSNEKYSDEPKT